MPKDYFDYNPEEEKEVVSETDKGGTSGNMQQPNFASDKNLFYIHLSFKWVILRD